MYRRKQDIEAAPLKDELLLFNAANNKFFVMNATAALLWERLREPAGEAALAEALCVAFSGVAPEGALADVRTTIAALLDLGLVIDDGTATDPTAT